MLSRLALAIRVLLKGMPEPVNSLPPSPESSDPLVAFSRHRRHRGDSIEDGEPLKFRTAMDDVYLPERMEARKFAFDSAESKKTWVGDAAGPKSQGQFGIPDSLQNWYISQSFIGWQCCAIIAQHWLVEKACAMAGEDAIRHGYEINIINKNDDGPTRDPDAEGIGNTTGGVGAEEASDDVIDRIKEIDSDFSIKKHCSEMSKFCNVFGIRLCIYEVEYEDPKAYEKPFNIDAVRRGSYKGIRQVDPYWTAPMLDSESASDPTSIRFYRPTWWVVGGRRYHWSHIFVAMGPEVADILKPQYYYGGVPLTQRIYERVYAAERTANEAPLLSMSKRTTALHVDLKKVSANQPEFERRLGEWVAYRDNHAVKVLGLEEVMEESDTSLSDFDSVIMNQFQLVAAIAETPSTKLMGTSPKGFNATGEFEMKSYHEKLESIQSNDYEPFLARHYELLCKSEGWDFAVEVAWNPVDAKTAEELADINEKKAATGERLINAGVISADEERSRVRTDKHSGYSNICSDQEADPDLLEPGELDKPGAGEKGEAALMEKSGEKQDSTSPENTGTTDSDAKTAELIRRTESLLAVLKEISTKSQASDKTNPSVQRSAKPTTAPSVVSELRGDISKKDEKDLPKKSWRGHQLAIENPKGSFRSGEDEKGTPWRSQMPADYGYFVGTKGADGDGVDVMVGAFGEFEHVHIINQVNPETGCFDEHKVMVGFGTAERAEQIYRDAYGQNWEGFGSIHQVQNDMLREWLNQGNMSEPYSSDWSVKGQTANNHEPTVE